MLREQNKKNKACIINNSGSTIDMSDNYSNPYGYNFYSRKNNNEYDYKKLYNKVSEEYLNR